MNRLQVIIGKEMKVGFRNRWTVSFLILFTLFLCSFTFIGKQMGVTGYTANSGLFINLVLYLLPLMVMLMGAISLVDEKDSRSWELLKTYPVSAWVFLLGKYIGIIAIMMSVILFAFCFTGIISLVSGAVYQFQVFSTPLVFSLLIAIIFSAIALLIGAVAKDRWQALSYVVVVWFVYIIIWPTLLIAVVGMLPYLWMKPVLIASVFLNPAELIRLFIIVKLGGGSILGPEYYQWVNWIQSATGTVLFYLVIALWISILFALTCSIWQRRGSR